MLGSLCQLPGYHSVLNQIKTDIVGHCLERGSRLAKEDNPKSAHVCHPMSPEVQLLLFHRFHKRRNDGNAAEQVPSPCLVPSSPFSTTSTMRV